MLDQLFVPFIRVDIHAGMSSHKGSLLLDNMLSYIMFLFPNDFIVIGDTSIPRGSAF